MKKDNIKEGETIEIETNSEKIKGVVIPSADKNKTVIKLESGYNISFEKKDIKKINILKKETRKEEIKKQEIKFNKELKTISVLHTGGTIASVVDYTTGAVVAKFSPEELIKMFPELREIANIKSRFIRNIMSENMRFAHYNLIAKEIEKEIKEGTEGIIITHGTDTMHYTAAALAFMLEGTPIPIILVGAQRSSDRGSSDSFMNMISAAHFITKTDFAEVGICMHSWISDESCFILPATKTRKMHTSRRDAFRPINTKPWAKIHENGRVEFLNKDYNKRGERKINIKPFKPNLKIGILKGHPNMHAEEINAYKKFDGLILEILGIGHMPTVTIDEFTKEHKKILESIRKLAKRTVVGVAPQTIYGEVNMNVYSPGRALKEAGVVGNYCDMTPETAFIKLAWLLSNYKKEEAKEMFEKDLRGEISKKISPDEFLI